MTKNFIEELRWRGMVHDAMPGTEEYLMEKMRSAYIGFDPTADSLHIGNLVPIMLLAHYQRAGHKPFALVGGATGMIGDPSGKSAERNFLDEKILLHNQEAIKIQLSRFLDFDSDTPNAAVLLNNYEWMKDFSFLDFIRDVGKHITINYMMAKDSVKNRISLESSEGMSFTEFTYQLVQGYDFLHLYKKYNCTLQMGGSDQWGNITTGTELIRRISSGKGYALTCPLITKSDGSKFGKSEGGNIWLDPNRTSPYKFYQYWLNTSDEDAEKYIKIFTFLTQEEIKDIVEKHKEAPHQRTLQKRLADEITVLVHSQEDLDNVLIASKALFGKDLEEVKEKIFEVLYDGIDCQEILREDVENGIDIINLLVDKTRFLKSNGEARRELKQNSISINRKKINDSYRLSLRDLIYNKYILIQKGKKNHFILKTVIDSNNQIQKFSVQNYADDSLGKYKEELKELLANEVENPIVLPDSISKGFKKGDEIKILNDGKEILLHFAASNKDNILALSKNICKTLKIDVSQSLYFKLKDNTIEVK